MKKLYVLTLSIFLFQFGATAQTLWRSIGSGAWDAGTTTVWEKSTDGGANWAASAGPPTTNQAATINTGHVINLNGASRNVQNLTINAGGTLTAGTAHGIRLGAGNAGNVGVLTNNGTFGGPTDIILFELPANAVSITLTGTGVSQIGRIRPSAVNTQAASAIIIDQSITLNSPSNYIISAVGGTLGASENITLSINKGKIVKAATGIDNMHNGGNSSVVGGIYTYNINGILDLSATTGNISLSPYTTSTSVITVNVNGTMKLGSGSFSMDTTSANNPVSWTGGVSRFNIANGGLLDATNANGTFKTGNALGQFIVVSGTGSLRRTAGSSSDVLFPIGTSLSSYSPAIINNAGTPDAFTISLGAVTNTGAIIDATKIVNKQWTIVETVPGGSNATLKLGWVTADQAAGFNSANPVVIGRWNGTGWEYYNATVSGTGTIADPYIASAPGITANFTSSNPFIVANKSALPVTIFGIKAYAKESGVQLEWSVGTEENVASYIVEKAINARDFATVATVAAKNVSSYSTYDATPVAGVNYYRIKVLDKDGSFKYSSVLPVNISKTKAEIVIAPNPVKGGQLNLQIGGLEKGNYSLRLYNDLGQEVFNSQLSTTGGSLSQSFTLPSTVKAGMYNLQLTGGDVKISKRVIVQ